MRLKRRFVTFGRIIHTGIINFMRNLSLAIAAMAVMIITLTIVLFSVIASATFQNTITQITSKIDVSVYLKDSTTVVQAQQLVNEIQALPNTQSVQYLNKAQVLKQYESQNAGNQQLQLAISQTSNPLPATIHIKPKNLNQLQDIKNFLSKPTIAALQSDPPSYSGSLKEAIDNITHATDILREVGVIAVIVFAIVSALIIFNTIQMAIFNRRDEIQIMRLLGASTTFIRGPYIVESAIYGLLSAVISVILINAIFVASSNTLQASTFGLLDINYATTYFDSHFWKLFGLQLAVGILIGIVSSFIATRRYLKFRVK
jgi:cell division transport system permease protein